MHKISHLLPITRDSVAAGDDVYAPHTQTVATSTPVDCHSLCESITAMDYLPQISGDTATRVLWMDGAPIGVISQNGEPEAFADAVVLTQISKAHCAYWAQRDPKAIHTTYAKPSSG